MENIYRLYSVHFEEDNQRYLFMFLPAGANGSHVDIRDSRPDAYKFGVNYRFLMLSEEQLTEQAEQS